MVKVRRHAFLSRLGKRQNNEDNFGIFSEETFVVCDGVGGADKGEVASEIVTKAFVHALKESPEKTAMDVIGSAEEHLSQYLVEHPSAVGMATTLALLQVRPKEIYVAWCGDSRVYQFRKGNIVFKTDDHSWVSEALAAGILTPEEAINHPKKNIITRAIQGTHKPAQIQDVVIINIQKGDRFLLCSDGILESWTDEDLQALFKEDLPPEQYVEIIQKECEEHSKDNFTAIVLEIEEGLMHDGCNDHPNKESSKESNTLTASVKKSPFIPGFNALGLILVLLLISGAFYVGMNWTKDKVPSTTVKKKSEKDRDSVIRRENNRENTPSSNVGDTVDGKKNNNRNNETKPQ